MPLCSPLTFCHLSFVLAKALAVPAQRHFSLVGILCSSSEGS
jgi:hypothetical protein